ncbi:MAG: ABC transporter ATP-binding protein [Candidatus Methanomethylophilaceae archaeon]|nr:ABC transporter ATP-binding protein [Candidatus Methanomethylophilaceae archaeon]
MKVTIEGMEFGYSDDSIVLNNIDLDISGPQLVSIVGPNGVGKSTLIHCINKILSPTKGVVMIDGKDVSQISIKEMSKIAGYVPYTANNSFPLSVVDTVLMGRHPHSSWKTTDEDLDLVYDTLRMLDIEHLALRSFNELSAGQHQRVMLARGLVQEPKILLLDEPTANLDIRHQMNVTRILRNLAHEKGILVVIISHDLNIAATYSDNVIMMYKGYIYDVGTPEKVFTEENLRMVYKVDSEITVKNGRPRIVLLDDLFDENEDTCPEDSYVTASHYIESKEPSSLIKNILDEDL